MKFAALIAVASAHEIVSETEYKFMAYIGKHNKSYATVAEYNFRLQQYAVRVAEHVRHNAEPGQTSTQGENFLTDRTDAEIKMMNGFKAPLGAAKNYTMFDESVIDAAGVDWRTKGAVTPVKNQGQCGSCWAFSSTGALEGAHHLATGNLVSLSEANLVNCSTKNNGCNGGLMDYAFEYAETNPIMTEKDWPDQPSKQFLGCYMHYKKSEGVATVSSYADVTPNTPSQLKAALATGPVSVAIEADKAAFQQYTGGVITGSACGTQLDHGVLAVGWGTDATAGDYFIVKNSWGPSWGDEGYVKIGAGSGAGVCGINSQPSIPTTN
jgi:C1A family cysteine protease